MRRSKAPSWNVDCVKWSHFKHMNKNKTLIAVGSMVAIIALGLFARSSFLRAEVAAQKNACIANLHQLVGYKELWRETFKKAPSDVPTDGDLKRLPIAGYYYGRERCPAGGVYTLGRLDQKPTCSVPGHVMPDEAKRSQ